MSPTTAMTPGPMLLWLTFGAAALALLLFIGIGRGRALRMGVVAALVALGFAAYATLRRPVRAPPGPPASVLLRAPARVPPARPPRPSQSPRPAQAPIPPDDQSWTMTTEMPDLQDVPEFAKNWLNAVGSPVRFEGSKLVIGGRVVKPDEDDEANSQPADATPQQQHAVEVELRANIQRDVAERLNDYFQDLVDEPAPATQRLRELRTELKQLSADARERIAAQASRLHTAVPRHPTVTARDSQTGRVEVYAPQAEFTPEQIRDLIKSELARARLHERPSTPVTIVGTIGAVVVAAIVLKAATRRQAGLSPRR